MLRAQSWAIAGLAWLHYGYLDWISRQSVPFTATDEYVHAWGALVGVSPKPPAGAHGFASFLGAVGASVSAGAIVVRGDQYSYQVVTGATILPGANIVTVPVMALYGGTRGNADPGTALTLVSPVPGINPGGVATTELVGGADPEPDDEFRMRMLQRYAAPPQGGSMADYVDWAEETPGVTRAWVTPNGSGPGTVLVYTMWDDSESPFGGIPQGTDGVSTEETRDKIATGDQLVVANQIFPLRPVTALVYSLAPIAYPIAFTIADLEPATDGVKAAIRTALAATFRRNAAPGGTVFPVTVVNAANGTMYPSEFAAAIASVSGVRRFTMAAPVAKIVAPRGNIPSLGAVTFS